MFTLMGIRTKKENRDKMIAVRVTQSECDALDRLTYLGDYEGRSDAGRALMLPYLHAMTEVMEGASSLSAGLHATKGMIELNKRLAEVERQNAKERRAKEQGELGLGLNPA